MEKQSQVEVTTDTIRLWDVATGEHLQTLIGHVDDVNSVSFSPDGKTIRKWE